MIMYVNHLHVGPTCRIGDYGYIKNNDELLSISASSMAGPVTLTNKMLAYSSSALGVVMHTDNRDAVMCSGELTIACL